MDLKVMPGKMTKLEKEANTYGQIHCVDVSTYKEVEWVQEKRRKCTSSFPKQAIEKTETVSRGLPINRLIGLSRSFSLIGLGFGHLIFLQKYLA